MVIYYSDYAEIVLCNNKQEEVSRTKIDLDDIERVIKYRWHKDIIKGYAKCSVPFMRLHQFIIGRKNGLVIDHINHDRLDNRKQNLRHCTQRENVLNSKAKNNKINIKKYLWNEIEDNCFQGLNNQCIHLPKLRQILEKYNIL